MEPFIGFDIKSIIIGPMLGGLGAAVEGRVWVLHHGPTVERHLDMLLLPTDPKLGEFLDYVKEQITGRKAQPPTPDEQHNA